MTDLTTRQLIETILRSLNENWDRMAAKYKGVAADQPAPELRAPAREEIGAGPREGTSSRSPSRS